MASLLEGKEVLSLLSTGFGKSLISQLFFVVAKIQRGRLHVTVVVSCPRQGIIADHVWTKMCLSAASVADLTVENDRGTLHDFSKYLVKPKRRLHK